VGHGKNRKVLWCTFCRKLMGLPKCAATGFAKKEFGRAGETIA